MNKTLYLIFLVPILYFLSCNKEDENNDPLYEIGEMAEGGIVFYIDETGKHGLVASLEDLSNQAIEDTIYDMFLNYSIISGYRWCKNSSYGTYQCNVYVGADESGLGFGLPNTTAIINFHETDDDYISAAEAIVNTEINGYSDWYLPSQAELTEMFSTIGPPPPTSFETFSSISNLNSLCSYWSSTELVSSNNYSSAIVVGYEQDSNGKITLRSDYVGKSEIRLVRPIRSF